MRLEQAILDRLEKRNGQIAQLQSTVHALERAADVEREHARQQLAQQNNEINGLRQLVNEKIAINEQLAEQITTARLEREQMQHQISELRTERDRIREISKSLVPKSALMQAVQEAAELHAEVVKLRAEVPLESTREGLKNAVAKLQEVTTDRDRVLNELAAIVAECAELQGKYESLLAAQNTVKADVAMVYQIADKLGRNQAESIPEFMERQALRLAALESEAGPTHSSIDWQVVARNLEQTVAGLNAKVAELQEVTTEKDRMRLQLENARADLKQALVERDSLGSMAADRALEIRKLMDGHAEDMKAQAEVQSKYESILTKTTDLGSYAMTLGRKEGEPLEMFMERQALRLAAFETKIELRPIENRIGHFAVICTKCDELARSRTELAEAMERVTQLRSESESLRAELQGYMAGESEAMEAAKVNGIQPFEKLAGFIYRHAACLRQAQAANAPLNKLYFTMRKHRDDCNISANAEPIYRAVDEASDAIKQLTA